MEAPAPTMSLAERLTPVALHFAWIGATIACALVLSPRWAVAAQCGLLLGSTGMRLLRRKRPGAESRRRGQRITPLWVPAAALAGAFAVAVALRRLPLVGDSRSGGPLSDPWFIPVILLAMATFWTLLAAGTAWRGTPMPQNVDAPEARE